MTQALAPLAEHKAVDVVETPEELAQELILATLLVHKHIRGDTWTLATFVRENTKNSEQYGRLKKLAPKCDIGVAEHKKKCNALVMIESQINTVAILSKNGYWIKST